MPDLPFSRAPKHIYVVPIGWGQRYYVINAASSTWYDQYDSAKTAQLAHPDLPLVRATMTGFLDLVNWHVMDMLAVECPYHEKEDTDGPHLCAGPIVPSSGLCRTHHNWQDSVEKPV